MAANVSKGVCIVVLFVETLLFGWPPYLLFKGGVQSERSSRLRGVVISYLTCFAGGVFMGACLLHLLVEGREVMEEYFEKADVNIEFPVYESITAGGFFLIGLVEQLAHKLLHKTHHNHSNYNSNNHNSHHHYQHHHQKRDSKSDAAVLNGSKRTDSGKSKRRSQNSKADSATGIDNIAYQMGTVQLTKKSNDGKDTDKAVAETELSTVSGNLSRVTPETKSYEKDRTNPSVYEAVTESAVTSQCGSENISADANIDETDQQIEIIQEKASEHEEEFRQIAEVMEVNPLRAFLLLGAMSFHTVFDGLAVGLQTQDSSVWEMFVAICIHKALVALCLGMQLFNVYKSRPVKAFLWVFFFSLISPIGVGIGMILTSGSFDETGESLSSWILQAMATGTFLYIALFEILRQELVEKGGVLRLLAAVVGFGGMAAAKALDSD